MLNKSDELKDRVEAKRHELLALMETLKADTRHEAIAAKDRIKQGLAELDKTIEGGWDKITDAVKTKLDAWLERNN